MATDIKISEMSDGGPVQPGDQIPVERSGTNVRVQAGTAAALDVGTDDGDVVQLETVGSNPGLPAVDGSQLTGLALTPINVAMNASSLTLTSIPAALTFASGNPRLVNSFDLSRYSQVRLNMCIGGTAGPAGSKIVAKFITAWSATPASWFDIGTTEVSIALDQATNAFYETAWIDIDPDALDEVLFAIFTEGGNGSSNPIITNVNLQFR